MRSWIVVGIGLLLVIGFAMSHWMRVTTNPANAPPPAPAQEAALDPDLARRAEQFLDLLDAQDYDKALAMTTPEEVKALGDGKLQGIWQALPMRLGQRQSRGAPRGQEIQGHEVIAERLQFEDVVLDARVVFDRQKRIAGFHLVPVHESPTETDKGQDM